AYRLRRRAGVEDREAGLTGRENVERIGRLYRLPVSLAPARAREVLERFGLAEAADRRVSGYSGGMRRRLDLCASLTGRPPVLLLDEPTTGLDPRTRQELWDTIDELRREGTTVLLTTQYLEEADRLAQRIAVVDHGRIAAQGTASELKATVGSEVLVVRVADSASTSAAAAVLADLSAGEEALVDAAAGEIRLAVLDPSASAEAVRRLDARGLAIAAVELTQPTLDDVFLTLTGRLAEERPAEDRPAEERSADRHPEPEARA
ncbi:MAG: ATP-binding cassette domain-containing protein, partial [Solirubrobacteraceae bacterium]